MMAEQPGGLDALSGDPVHIAYCLGTRPEVIRSARLLSLLSDDPAVRLSIVNSGQHFDPNMFGDFFDELRVPNTTAELGVGTSDPAQQTGDILKRSAALFARIRPELICVFGDTNSSLGFSLAAVKSRIPLVHIEAGCRSNDVTMPEEINRRLIDHCADLLLPVSELAASNVRNERALGEIEMVGDPLFDVYSRLSVGLQRAPDELTGLFTLHRPSNVDDPDHLVQILEELSVASMRTGVHWVFPVHPRTRRMLPRRVPVAIFIGDPLPYSKLLALLRSAAVCVTDSGGLQKEALWAEVPCVTIRSTTEWMETVWQGVNVLAPLGSDIAGAIVDSLHESRARDFSNPYGDGRASERIAKGLKRWITRRRRTRDHGVHVGRLRVGRSDT
jgi:UDP-GlcNAc3NAcA epimerase